MRYLKGDGVHTPLSRLVLYPRFSVYVSVIVVQNVRPGFNPHGDNKDFFINLVIMYWTLKK